ncbi:phosphatidylcholine transfer protein, putative [Eimeria mitis]|uniref:Phosphatidylcholine transfer protein, putative n=1 Tax=Eimeria mitis TaxID=44415 RepID=U6KHP0_9EIME|nr:phosphatidylcholine transfer protein, putative [Eimeria mitis]CDJ35787.1 phosphatidylcholine transfer protein, putative [Eimeria mitis]
MTAVRNEQNSSPSPCRIIVHSEETFQNETDAQGDPLTVLEEKEHGDPEQVALAGEGNVFYQESCAAGGRTTVSNPCSRGSRAATPMPRKPIDAMTNPAVPQGYLKYWALRVGQEAAHIPESEEFELAYAKKAQSLFPFRSTTTEWTVNTAGGFLVLLMPWGPVMMVFGLCFGGLLGFGLAMANDMCRLRKKTSAATQQKKKIDHLMRWAGYHFASSNAQLQLIFKVIMEYEVLARLGDISKTARAQLRLLYSFLSRDDVGHCLWLYLDYFEAHCDHMTRSEIFMCALVCYVCTQCAGTLRKRNLHPVVSRMIRMMNDAEIQKIFQKSKSPNPRQAKQDEETERCLFYADNSQGVQTFVMKGGDLLQSLHNNDGTAGRHADSSEGGSFTDAFSGSNFESDVSNGGEEKQELVQETLAGELRPVENFNVALTYGVSLERALGCTLEGTNSSATASLSKQLPAPSPAPTAVKTHRRKTSSVVSNTRSTSRVSRQPTQTQIQAPTQTQTHGETTHAEEKHKG